MQDKTKTLRPITLNPDYLKYKEDREKWIKKNLTQEQIQKMNTLKNGSLIAYQREVGLIGFVTNYWKKKNKRVKIGG